VAKALRSVIPSRILNALYYVAPVWMGTVEFAAVAVGLVTLALWLLTELRLLAPNVSLRLPVYWRPASGSEPTETESTPEEEPTDSGD